MLKICMVEICDDKDVGSIGCFYVVEALKRAGFEIDVLRKTSKGYDVELLSVHHCSNFPLVRDMKQYAPLRIVGGHPMQNNPRPIIRYCDAVFIGEGEVEIVSAMRKIENKISINEICEQSTEGWLLSSSHVDGADITPAHYEKELPTDNPVYLNRTGTRSASWYIEAARGCPFKCAYCELGNSAPYRKHSWEHIQSLVEKTDTSKAKKINLFAPDESSLPYYDSFLDTIHSLKMSTNFSSMHFKTVKKTSKKFRKNHLFRMGLDGMTEKTRFRVGKKIRDIDVMRFFQTKTNDGYVRFKIFMIFGYPWDTVEDFEHFKNMMDGVFRLPFPKNINLRIKWTPFIPQPCTPLAKSSVIYRHDIRDEIENWHEMVKSPRYGRESTGIYIDNDGIMGEKRYNREVSLTSGDENTLDLIRS